MPSREDIISEWYAQCPPEKLERINTVFADPRIADVVTAFAMQLEQVSTVLGDWEALFFALRCVIDMGEYLNERSRVVRLVVKPEEDL